MALEHRDYYREKKPDWDNISFPDNISFSKEEKPLWKSVVWAILSFSAAAFCFYARFVF